MHRCMVLWAQLLRLLVCRPPSGSGSCLKYGADGDVNDGSESDDVHVAWYNGRMDSYSSRTETTRATLLDA
jgi:hypothetical protein